MPCILTNGYSIGECAVGTGGVHTLYAGLHVKGTDYAFSTTTGNIVDAYDTTGSYDLNLFKIEQEMELAVSSETVTVDRATGTRFFEQSISMTLHFTSDDTVNDQIRLLVDELTKSNVVLVVRDNNGRHRLFGAENGLRATTGEGGTGTAFGDLNGVTITLTGKEPEQSYVLDLTDTTTVGTYGEAVATAS